MSQWKCYSWCHPRSLSLSLVISFCTVPLALRDGARSGCGWSFFLSMTGTAMTWCHLAYWLSLAVLFLIGGCIGRLCHMMVVLHYCILAPSCYSIYFNITLHCLTKVSCMISHHHIPLYELVIILLCCIMPTLDLILDYVIERMPTSTPQAPFNEK